jgi:hypothetical protein
VVLAVARIKTILGVVARVDMQMLAVLAVVLLRHRLVKQLARQLPVVQGEVELAALTSVAEVEVV